MPGVPRTPLLDGYNPDQRVAGLCTQTKKKHNYQEEAEECVRDWERYDQNIAKRRIYIYAADLKGVVHVYTLGELFARKKICEQERMKKG